MRFGIVIIPMIAATLSSCSIAVRLVVTNDSLDTISIESEEMVRRLKPQQVEKTFEWPVDRILIVRSASCTRSYDLDEKYTPANEWRLSWSKIERRYTVYGHGQMRIELPDKAHMWARAKPPENLALTAISERCSH